MTLDLICFLQFLFFANMSPLNTFYATNSILRTATTLYFSEYIYKSLVSGFLIVLVDQSIKKLLSGRLINIVGRSDA